MVFVKSPFGECLLAITERGICYFGFVEADDRAETLGQLFRTWPGSEFIEDRERIRILVKNIFRIDRMKNPTPVQFAS